jgi:uncharacterized phage-associated protein
MRTDDSYTDDLGEGPFGLQELIDSFATLDQLEGTEPSDISDIPAGDVRQQNIPTPSPNVSALDVAEYILRRRGRMSTMKLQKLVYYSQAWSLVWDERPLFYEDVEAWANGPVIRELFNYHRGMFEIEHVVTGNADLLSASEKETVDSVLNFYGDKPAQWLIDLSHSEEPWRRARMGLPETARGARRISLDSMAEYYSSLSGD